MRGQVVCAITDDSSVGAARRRAAQLAEEAGLSAEEKGQLGIVVTELGRNVAIHATRGVLFIQRLHEGADSAIEVLAVDSGPGMADLGQCLRDGYSTNGTPGTGLGAVKRISGEFDAYTRHGAGTIVLSRIFSGKRAGNGAMSFGAMSTCAPGETECGDGWSLVCDNGNIALLVADGLGHGPEAATAANGAARVFEARAFAPLNEYFDEAHRALRSTRGAAVAVAQFTSSSGALLYAGVGNIAGTVLDRDGRSHGLVSNNGTVGAHMRAVRPLSCAWPDGDLLVMHSDGLKSAWSLSGYPGLRARHPAIVGAVLHRDFQRGADDATIVVLRRGE
jgi:anti-sigma regulatory factor (Ser/Thr protein kinase)